MSNKEALVSTAESLSRAIASLPPDAGRERLMLCGELANVVQFIRYECSPITMYTSPLETVAPDTTPPV